MLPEMQLRGAREVGIGGRGDNERRGGEGHYNPESELLTCSVES